MVMGSGRDAPLLRVEGLGVRFGPVTAVTDVSLAINDGEFVGVVGESGAGKSATARAIVGLLPPHARVTGSVKVRGEEVVGAAAGTLRRLRGRKVGFVFQDALTALDPVYTAGSQLIEALQAARPGTPNRTARRIAAELLDEVQIRDPYRCLDSYPHQLSGGMRQRVAIAIALVGNPELIIADEPTSALDVTVQKRVLDLLTRVCADRQAAVMLITHDLGVVAQACDRVVVLYGGIVAEEAEVVEMFDHPYHPYSAALLRSLPRLGDRSEIHPIPGAPGQIIGDLVTCPFGPRCSEHTDKCDEGVPAEVHPSASRRVRCVRQFEVGT